MFALISISLYTGVRVLHRKGKMFCVLNVYPCISTFYCIFSFFLVALALWLFMKIIEIAVTWYKLN